MTALDRFFAFVDFADSDCWIWRGTKTHAPPRDYGRFWDGRRMVLAHRFAYETFRGCIPEGLVPDHLCRIPACANPWHLEPVTHSENIRRGNNQFRDKPNCKFGHVLSARTDRTQRHCPVCMRAARRRYRDKVSAALAALITYRASQTERTKS